MTRQRRSRPPRSKKKQTLRKKRVPVPRKRKRTPMTSKSKSHRAEHDKDQDEPQADYQFKGSKEKPPAPEHLVVNPGMTITWHGGKDQTETRQLGGVEMQAGVPVPFTDFVDGHGAHCVAAIYEKE